MPDSVKKAVPNPFARIWQGVRKDAGLRPFAGVVAGLGLVLYAVHLFHVEAVAGFLRLTPLIFGGFLVHAWLPARYRLPFFVVLSFAAIGVVLGPMDGPAVIGLGLMLVGLCHLPVAFPLRVGLVGAVGVGLAALRAGWITVVGWPSFADGVLPVVAGLFMFRLMIYLYDLRHERKPASVWERLAYFFLLPNVCFPLFPVVDYQTFRRTYYDRTDPLPIYRKGVQRMFRGVTHLLLYRVVYLYLVPDPIGPAGSAGVVQYMVTTYLLYLRISGLFHLITGVLALFGFNLPETYRHYFLASSFNDYWRRINIYWKDFMLKLFYYPTLMRLRKIGPLTAVAGGVVAVFVATWFLHAYQWFWLRGAFHVTAPDVLFWALFALLMVVNSLFEAKRGRKRASGGGGFRFRQAGGHAARVVGMFTGVTVLWTLWSSRTLAEFGALMGVLGRGGMAFLAYLLGGLAALVALGTGWQWMRSRRDASVPPRNWPAVLGAAALVALALSLGRGWLGDDLTTRFGPLIHDRYDQRDDVLQNRGYYEGLLAPGGFLRYGERQAERVDR